MAEPEYALLRTELLARRGRLESVRARTATAEVANLLEEIDAALDRMERGAYGLCEECHDPIEKDRLLADPFVRFCVDHLSVSERRALEADLDLALSIQTRLLPSPNLAAAGWEVSYYYEPAGPVSGDYCDVISPDAGASCLYFLLGDVSGKGVAASLLMSHLHALFRALLSSGLAVPQLTARANRLFCESTLPSHYATLVCARAEPGGEIEISNAGHCPPVLLRAAGPMTIEATGLPLGLFCSGHYTSATATLHAGDSLLLYTDGLTEARNPADEEFGLDRLFAAVAGCHGLPAHATVDAVLSAWNAFRAGVPKFDDLTVMAIRRLGPLE